MTIKLSNSGLMPWCVLMSTTFIPIPLFITSEIQGRPGLFWYVFASGDITLAWLKTLQSAYCHRIVHSFVYQNNLDPNESIVLASAAPHQSTQPLMFQITRDGVSWARSWASQYIRDKSWLKNGFLSLLCLKLLDDTTICLKAQSRPNSKSWLNGHHGRSLTIPSIISFEIVCAKGLLLRKSWSAQDEWYDYHQTIQSLFTTIFSTLSHGPAYPLTLCPNKPRTSVTILKSLRHLWWLAKPRSRV